MSEMDSKPPNPGFQMPSNFTDHAYRRDPWIVEGRPGTRKFPLSMLSTIVPHKNQTESASAQNTKLIWNYGGSTVLYVMMHTSN